MKRFLISGCVFLATATGCVSMPQPEVAHSPPAANQAEDAATPNPCPRDAALPYSVRCFAGRDAAGSYVLLAVPADWNGILVLHAHGGPFLGPPTMKRVDEDLTRWSIVPRSGYAWAATSYHQGGVAVLAGGPRAYEHRFDLRIVYQYLCGNHPEPAEPQYPLWMGLPEESSLTQAALTARIEECLGWSRKAEARTPEQARRMRTLLSIVHIPESSIPSELSFATFTFQDIARRYGWHGVFGNIGVLYHGSDDDAALNAGVQRYPADTAAVQAYRDDTDLMGVIDVPVLTMHAIHDPTAFVEMERLFGDRMTAAGYGANLVQTFSDDRVHSYVSDATYVALLDALATWVRTGRQPTPDGIAQACAEAVNLYPSTCHFRPGYRPAPLQSKVADRVRP